MYRRQTPKSLTRPAGRTIYFKRGEDKTGAGEESRTLDLNLGKVALYQLSYSRIGVYVDQLFTATNPASRRETGAGEESRTLDLNLGKVALYQLSYSRMGRYCSNVS
jgi:hypothetical protein